MIALLRVEAIKLRRTWVWPLVALGPFGVVSLNALHYLLNRAGLVTPGAGAANWLRLLTGINSLLVPTLAVGVAIVAALVAGLEQRGRMWKALRALPLPAWQLYAAKFACALGVLAVASAACAVGTVALGVLLGLGPAVPWTAVAWEGVRPYLAAYALVALQLALSVLLRSQAVAIGAGILAFILSVAATALPRWLPWVYPALASPVAGIHPAPAPAALAALAAGWAYVAAGVALGIAGAAVGAWAFGRQDTP